jgi:K+-transporting ATPase A subunit
MNGHDFIQLVLCRATLGALTLPLGRGLTRAGLSSIGNFWADLTRPTLELLLPIKYGQGRDDNVFLRH